MEKHQEQVAAGRDRSALRGAYRLRPVRRAKALIDLRRDGHGLCRHGDGGTLPFGHAGGKSPRPAPTSGYPPGATSSALAPTVNPPVDPSDTDALVRRMLAQSRHALLLRKQVVGNLREDQFREACEQLHARMGLVPEGDVVLCKTNDDDEGDLYRYIGPTATVGPARTRCSAVPRPLHGDQSAVLRVRRGGRLSRHDALGSAGLAGGARSGRSDGPARAGLLATRPLSAGRGGPAGRGRQLV